MRHGLVPQTLRNIDRPAVRIELHPPFLSLRRAHLLGCGFAVQDEHE